MFGKWSSYTIMIVLGKSCIYLGKCVKGSAACQENGNKGKYKVSHFAETSSVWSACPASAKKFGAMMNISWCVVSENESLLKNNWLPQIKPTKNHHFSTCPRCDMYKNMEKCSKLFPWTGRQDTANVVDVSSMAGLEEVTSLLFEDVVLLVPSVLDAQSSWDEIQHLKFWGYGSYGKEWDAPFSWW